MPERISEMLSELVVAEHKAGVLSADESNIRTTAMREVFRSWDRLSVGQLQEAMTLAHFETYFSDALSRMFLQDYTYQVGSWTNYVYHDEVPDFRDVDRFRGTEPEGLLLRGEKEDIKATYIEIDKIYYGVEEYARQFDVSWRAILNDDLGKIKETPTKMVRAANRWLDAWVSALYDNATTQAALLALGLVYGGTGRLTHANLAIGLNAMMQRTDANGNMIQITGVNLVIPPVSQIQASTVLESILASGVATNDKNVLGRFLRGVYVDPYIAFTMPNVPWYLVAVPAEINTITVARLRGMPGPIIAKKRSDMELISGSAPAPMMMGSFATGDIEYMVLDIVGAWDNASYVGVTDINGIYYSNGTTA